MGHRELIEEARERNEGGDCGRAAACAIEAYEKLLEENKRNYDKWWDYEQKYILPMFEWAEIAGIDLRRLVAEGAGRNCAQLLFWELRDRLKKKELDFERVMQLLRVSNKVMTDILERYDAEHVAALRATKLPRPTEEG